MYNSGVVFGLLIEVYNGIVFTHMSNLTMASEVRSTKRI